MDGASTTGSKQDLVNCVHRRVFGTTPAFGAEFSGIVCEARDLDRLNPSADPEMARYAKQFVEAMPGASRRSVAQEVRKAIYLLLPQGRATIEQVASGLGMNVRALQRQLSAAGSVYSDLLDDVRRDLAERYLENDTHTITEIGAMLGFSHSSAFSRWYRAQFGASPAHAKAASASHAQQAMGARPFMTRFPEKSAWPAQWPSRVGGRGRDGNRPP